MERGTHGFVLTYYQDMFAMSIYSDRLTWGGEGKEEGGTHEGV